MSDQPDYVRRAIEEPVAIVPYDPDWPSLFEQEAARLRATLPQELIGRIEHFGSTAVPGLAAKPIIDMLVEVVSLDEVRDRIAPILQDRGYEFFWRPSALGGHDVAYAWFIKRDADGRRTHHIHMLEADSKDWERLLFRDYLIEHPGEAAAYAALKRRAAAEHGGDRQAYARAKSDFIEGIMRKARRHFAGAPD